MKWISTRLQLRNPAHFNGQWNLSYCRRHTWIELHFSVIRWHRTPLFIINGSWDENFLLFFHQKGITLKWPFPVSDLIRTAFPSRSYRVNVIIPSSDCIVQFFWCGQSKVLSVSCSQWQQLRNWTVHKIASYYVASRPTSRAAVPSGPVRSQSIDGQKFNWWLINPTNVLVN